MFHDDSSGSDEYRGLVTVIELAAATAIIVLVFQFFEWVLFRG